MAGKIIVSSVQSDTDNSISFVANTGATIFSANLSHGIAGSFIADGTITAAKIADGAIVATEIADGAVTGPKLGLTSINANNIVNATITGAKLAANTVTGDVIGQNAISSNNIVSVNASVATVGTLPKARLPAGSILQVVQTVKSDTFAGSIGAVWTDLTGMSVSITPTSSSSKIMIVADIKGSGSYGTSIVRTRLLRDSTAIYVGNAASNRPLSLGQFYVGSAADNIHYLAQLGGSYIDSPATTSTVTYKIQIGSDGVSQTVYVNRTEGDRDNAYFDSRVASSIILMEIAA